MRRCAMRFVFAALLANVALAVNVAAAFEPLRICDYQS
jgi:hypothetical protein